MSESTSRPGGADRAFVLVDVEGHIRSWSPAAGRLLAGSCDAPAAPHLAAFFASGAGPDWDRAMQKGRWAGTCTAAYSGTELAVHLTRHDAGETPAGFVVEIHGTDSELRRSLAEEAEALAQVGSFEWDIEADRVTWSPEMHRIFGLELGAFGETVASFLELVHPEDRDRVASDLERALGQASFKHEERILRRDGAVRHLESAGRAIRDTAGRPTKMIGACRDITERKQHEQLLRWQVDGLDLLATMARDLLTLESEAAEERWLRQLAHHLGCEVFTCYTHAAGADQPHLVAVQGLPAAAAAADLALSRRCAASGTELAFRGDELRDAGAATLHAGGIHTYAVTPLLSSGRTLGTLAFAAAQRRGFEPAALDFIRTAGQLVAGSITNRTARRALAENDLRYRTLLDSAGDAIFVIDSDSRFVDVNEEACASLGYSRDELIGLSVFDVEVGVTTEELEGWRATRQPEQARMLVGVHRRKDGTRFPVEVRSSLVQLDGAPWTVAIARNVADRQALEEQLIHSQKMEAVGQLAGGIAHDFNNLLTIINTTVDLLLLRPAYATDDRGNLRAIQQAGNRAAELTSKLLLFSRASVANIDVVDLGQVVAGCEPLLRSVIGENVELVMQPLDEAVPVLADAMQIEQVMMNLAVNARDAMPKGGKLDIALRRVESAHTEAALGPDASRYAELRITDTGTGMAADVRSRIFEPFFTTKEPGTGTGLGLAVVYGIVRRSHGRIVVDSQPGQGSTFRIYLPLTSREAPTPPRRTPPIGSGSECVLLVEDEALVRTVVRQALESSGYRVLEAGSAHEAMALAAQHEGALSLVLTDVIMPDVDGRTLARQLTDGNAKLKVLFMSGYSEETIARRVPREPITNLIHKPFTASHLVERVRATLDMPN
ncbi:MAG: PAS domain S-box protein [Planctomycetota bacterium]